MYNFILQISLMASLGVMVYLVGRAVPRVNDEVAEPSDKSKIEKLISSLPLDRLDAAFSNFLEKFLRRLRLILLKLDNAVGGHLNKIKKMNNITQKNGEEKATLFNTNGVSGDDHNIQDESIDGKNELSDGSGN